MKPNERRARRAREASSQVETADTKWDDIAFYDVIFSAALVAALVRRDQSAVGVEPK